MNFSKIALLLELLVVVFIYESIDNQVVLVLTKCGLTHGALSTLQLWLLITSISLLVVIAMTYFSQRLRGDKFSDYGLEIAKVPSAKTAGIILGLSLLWQIICTFGIEKVAILYFHQPLNLPPVKTLQDLFVGIIMSFTGGGFREELFFRGYLINKISKLLGSAPWTIWLASVLQIMLFAQGHIYQGITGVIETALSAIIFTGVYLRSRSLWQSILFHTLYDIFGFIAIYLKL